MATNPLGTMDTGVGLIGGVLAGDDVISEGVYPATGYGVGNDTGAGMVTGNTVGCVVIAPTGADIGILVGAGTFPKLLSMHIPSVSTPTQSPTNRFEQSKYGLNVESETATTAHQLQ